MMEGDVLSSRSGSVSSFLISDQTGVAKIEVYIVFVNQLIFIIASFDFAGL